MKESPQIHYQMKRSEDEGRWVDIAEKVREARLRWYGHVIRRDEGEPSDTLSNEEIRRCGVVNIAEKVREARLRWHRHEIRRYKGEPVKNIME